MPVNDSLGIRMKTVYEQIPQITLKKKVPVAIRIDGKAFHTFTKGFQKPFDEAFGDAMIQTMEYLAKNIQGCIFAYQQSDEITLILIDYQTPETCAWFDYKVQKMCSIAASMATMAFNRYFSEEIQKFPIMNFYNKNSEDQYEIYKKALDKGAMFDARCFNIPKEEVCNLIYWRQLDAIRNSIQMVGQANFSHKQLQNKNCNDIKDMLMQEKNIDWNNFPTHWKRGTAWTKELGIDLDMPVLKGGKNRKYIEDLIYVGE